MRKNKDHQAAYRERMAEKGFFPTTIYLSEAEKEQLLIYITLMRDSESPFYVPAPRAVPIFERVNPNSKHYDKALAEKVARLA